jgi:hypothetical protein
LKGRHTNIIGILAGSLSLREIFPLSENAFFTAEKLIRHSGVIETIQHMIANSKAISKTLQSLK